MQDKHKDLKSTKQRQILQGLVEQLSRESPDFYYQSTIEVAIQLAQMIAKSSNVSQEEKGILAGLTHHDIQMILSLH